MILDENPKGIAVRQADVRPRPSGHANSNHDEIPRIMREDTWHAEETDCAIWNI